jgi:hypothetical protein
MGPFALDLDAAAAGAQPLGDQLGGVAFALRRRWSFQAGEAEDQIPPAVLVMPSHGPQCPIFRPDTVG